MENLCSEDQQENATSYCICRFPLPSFCFRHAEEHQTKKADFHFILPLTARNIITTKDVYYQVKSWLYQLNSKFEILHDKLADADTWEVRVEAAYQECLQLAAQAKERQMQALAISKAKWQTAVEDAIKETRLHALDTQSFVPVDSLSQLLWFQEPGYVSSYPFYSFRADCAIENFDSVLQIALSFDIPGFDQLNVGKRDSPSQVQVEKLTQELLRMENKLELEKQANEALSSQIQTITQQFNTKESQLRTDLETRDQQIPKMNTEIESLKQQVQDLTKQLNETNAANEKVLQRSSPPDQRDRPLEETMSGWNCSRCGQSNPVYCGQCQQCGNLNVKAADTSAATKILAGNALQTNRQFTSLWLCSNCKYQSLPQFQWCVRCHQRRRT